MAETSNVTVRLTDDEKRLVKDAALAEDVSSSEWMAQLIRREARRSYRARQIAAYTGPDAETRQWQDAADDAARSMADFTAAETA